MERLSDYEFELPNHLIAQRPLKQRTDSRLLALTAAMAQPKHDAFTNIASYLKAGDTLVLNDTRVFKARLHGKKQSGGKVELLVTSPSTSGNWNVLAKTSRPLKPGSFIEFDAGRYFAEVIQRTAHDSGGYELKFSHNVFEICEALGTIPLPPYMERKADEDDLDRYQTVFSDPEKKGAVAAPTAGLHFDAAMLDGLRANGIKTACVTLHVGPGTFLPVKSSNLDEHEMHSERWSIEKDAAQVLNDTKSSGGRIVAVGTTCVRTLEAAMDLATDGRFREASGHTKLFIRPGYSFKAVDALITNFHLPKSTLLMLVSAAVGRELLLASYLEAVKKEYRFFSYGDACFFEVRDNL